MEQGTLQRFSFDGMPVRGALVRLEGAWREVLRRRERTGSFPTAVRELLGEMSAAGALMQSSIKFDGALVLQLRGDGPVRMAVAEVSSALAFRATAQVVGEVAADASLDAMINVEGGGRCAITLDPLDRSRQQMPYQGIVPLEGEHGDALPRLADALEFYMRQSEQLATHFVLAASDDAAAGLMLQRVPGGGTQAYSEARDIEAVEREADFERIVALGTSVTRDELLALDLRTMLKRLFWQEPLRAYNPDPVLFRCSCDRERVRGMLRGLGRAEVDDIIAERERVEVGCEFCGEQYHFDSVDAREIFAADDLQPHTPDTLQ